MNNFGLGLILSFRDNATAGIQNATRSFQDLNNTVSNFSQANNIDSALMSISVAAGIVGDDLMSVGESIISFYTGVTSSIIETGTTMMTAQTQLATLYGSDMLGVQKLAEIKEYAKNSIFNFEDLIPSVIMLKANGIEAFDQIATSAYLASDGMEGAKQTLMDYAADLAAFNPQMKNSYGTGVQAAMGALNEYIAEGNAMSLKRGASLDINQLIGEDTAGTIEERSRQVADLIEKLGMVGMTANLAGTPMQRLSNVSDVFFNLMSDISNSGVFEKYSELVAKFTDYLFAIPDEELKNIAEVIGGALVDLITPFEYVIDLGIKAVDWLRETVKTNPELVQTTIKTIAMAGAFMLLSGIVLKLASSLGMLKITIGGLFGGNALTGGFKLLGLFKNLLLYIAPIAAALVLFKLAWDRNFMGIQETTKNTAKKVWESLKLIFDAFTDNTLSEDNFKKAQELGILPLIEGILQLKYHWGFFVEGLKKGVDAFFQTVKDILLKTGILETDVTSLGELVVALIDKMTAPGMTETWEKVGAFVGETGMWLLVIVAILPPIIKLVGMIITPIKWIAKGVKGIIKAVKFFTSGTFFTKISGFLTKIGDIIFKIKNFFVGLGSKLASVGRAFSTIGSYILKGIKFIPKLFGGLKSGIVWLLTGIGSITTAILGAMGVVVTLPAWVVGLIVVAIVAALTAIVALIVHFWDEIKAFFIMVGNAIAEFFLKIWDIIKDNPIVQIITNIVLTIKDIIMSIVDFVVFVVSGIVDIIKTLASAIWSILKSIYEVIKSVVLGIWDIIKSVADFIGNIIYVIYEAIRVVVLAIIWVFQQLWDAIQIGLDFICNVFSTAFNWVYNNVISPVVDAISTAFNWLCDMVFVPVGDFISDIFEGIADVVETVVEKFTSGFGTVKDFVCEAIQAVADFVNPILEEIGDTITWIADSITGIIDAASGALGWVGDKLSSAGDAISEMVGLSTGGYVKTTGIAVLHPNEVVVNDSITQNLKSFLNDYNNTDKNLGKQSVVNQTTIINNSSHKNQSNRFDVRDETRVVNTLMILNDSLSNIENVIKNQSLGNVNPVIPSTSVINTYPTSVTNNKVIEKEITEFNDSGIIKSLLSLNDKLDKVQTNSTTSILNSYPVSNVSNSTVNNNNVTENFDDTQILGTLVTLRDSLENVGVSSNSVTNNYPTSVVHNVVNNSGIAFDDTKIIRSIYNLSENLGDYISSDTKKIQPNVEHNVVNNSTQENYINKWENVLDDTRIIETLFTLNSTLGSINSRVKDGHNRVGNVTTSTSVINNNNPMSVINNQEVINNMKTDNTDVFRSLIGLNNTLDNLDVGKTTSIVDNSVINNSTKVDEIKTVAVLEGILNVITKKSDGITKLMKNSSPLVNKEDNYSNIIPVIKGLIDSVCSYGIQHYNNSPLIRQDIVADNEYSERPEVVNIETEPQDNDKDKDKPVEDSPIQNFIENSTISNEYNKEENNSDTNDYTDNRIIFESGSIVIKVENNGNSLSKEELNKCADELMQIIGRKMQLKNLQTRR